MLLKGLMVLSGLVFGAQLASAVDYHGYFRSGLGASSGGVDQRCFSLDGTSTSFRLGNECDTYVEVAVDQNHSAVKADESVIFKSHFRATFSSAGHRDWESTDPALVGNPPTDVNAAAKVALREAWVESAAVMPLNASLWAGKRFYRREDIHMLDFIYLSNTGPGVGLENMNVGPYKLHLALTRNVPSPQSKQMPAQTNVDLRLTDLKFGQSMQITPYLIYGAVGERGFRGGEKLWHPSKGTNFGVILSDSFKTGSSDKLILQYGSGIFGGSSDWNSCLLDQYGAWGSNEVESDDEDGAKARDGSSCLRFIYHGVMAEANPVGWEAVLMVQSTDFGGAKVVDATQKKEVKMPSKGEYTAGVRVINKISDHFDIAAEVGHQIVSDKRMSSSDDGVAFGETSMTKFTIAPEVTPNTSYWARPRLRVFYTYANTTSKADNEDKESSEKDWSVGAQTEVWW